MKGEGPPGVPGWGKEVRGSECRFNLMGVHPCRQAGEPCREATLISTTSTPEEADVWTGGGGRYMDVCAECWMVCDRRGKVEKEITENMTVGVRRHFYPRDLTHLFVQSVKEDTGSGATGPVSNLSIPIICYLLLHPAQHASPWPSSLLPLRCIPSPLAVIKTTGGIRNAA